MKRFLKSRRLTAILIFLDAAAFSGIWLGSYYLRDALARRGVINLPINEVSNYVLALKVYLPLWLAVIWHYGLYDHREKITGLNQVSSILRALIAGSIFSLAVAYLFKPWDLGRFVLILTPPLYALWLYASRSWLRAWKQRQILRGVGVTNVLIIGVGRTARRVKERIVNHPEGGYRIVGFVDPHPRRRLTEIDGIPVLGRTSKIVDILARHEVDVAFLAVPHMPQNEIMNLVVQCEHSGVPFKIVSNLFEVITSQVRIDVIDEVPVVHLKNAELPWLQRLLKRILDVVVASVLLVMFAIPMLIFAIIIKLDSPGPVLFRHRRVGKGGRLFTMYKFRTMRTDSDPYAPAPTDPDDARVTRCGRWMRRYSFDEFPQLINVLLGDMSMVGPRPEMPFIVERYEEWQKRRLDVKPGVTGLWQIVGRKNLPLALNLEYDFYYIKNQSLFFDIVILIKTIPAVVFGKGAF
jgi:exopolysaccharide biosynthesis polyprenyl glycosylphosphotransferase